MTRVPGGRVLPAFFGLLLIVGAGGVLSCSRPASSDATGAAVAAKPDPPDIFLVTIDTLRADALGFAGNRNVSTPNLDRMAHEALVFERAHASNVVTLPSHANILTGLYPHQHGVRENSGFRLDEKIPTLATLLRARGYATGAFVGAFPLDSRFGLAQGFDVYDDSYPPGGSPYDFEMSERPGTEVVRAALEWHGKTAGRPRFVWVHLFDPHAPYRPPAPFAAEYAGSPYLGEVAATDAALAPLLDAARPSGPRRAVLLFTSDHGEALGDHGEATHGLFAYEATLRVPLFVWAPGVIAPGRSPDWVRHVDIAPTLLHLAGVPPPVGLPGRSLLPLPPGEARGEGGDNANHLYFEALSASLNRGWAPLTGVLEGGFKLIDLPIPELYDLASDPAERKNLFSQKRDVARRLKLKIPGGASSAAVPRAPDSEEARRLLSLGYLSGSARRKTSYTVEDDPKRLVALDGKIHRVVDLFQRGDARHAAALASEMVRERPSMAVGYEFLAFLLQSQGHGAEAAKVLAAAAAKGLASEEMEARRALILSEAGRPAEALAVLRPFASSPNLDTQNAIGIALADAGRTGEALEVFRRITERDPGNAIAQQNRGIALLKSGDAAAALAGLDAALLINANLPRALNARGVAQAKLGDPRGAIESWRRAAELDPRQYDALLNIGLVAAGEGNLGIAREALRRFVETAPPALYGRDIQQARRMLREIGGA